MNSCPHCKRPMFTSVDSVIRDVAAKHKISHAEMLSERRELRLVRARQEAYWRCTKETAASLTLIGRIFGDRDHSTIIKGARRHAKRMMEASA